MLFILKCLIIFKFLSISWSPIKCEQNWNYDLVALDTVAETPEIVNVSLHLIRVSRGVYAFSGTLMVGEDLDEHTIVYADCYYSLSGSNMVLSPYKIPRIPLPIFIRTYYKELMMDSLQSCTVNAPGEDIGEVLTKRLITFENCIISNEGLPSYVKNGYYRIIFAFTGQAKIKIIFLFKVESNQ